MMMHFQNPWLLLLAPVAVILIFMADRGQRPPAVRFTTGRIISSAGTTLRTILSRRLMILRLVAAVLIVIAIARPQEMLEKSFMETEGVDIVLAIDTSTSMLAEDFKLRGRRANRLDVVKSVVNEFIGNRKSDRIGIVVFAARPYIVSPMTLDYGWLMQNLERVKIGMIDDGTAIGSGLSVALKRLRDSAARSKVVILLTDGRNNAGRISPLTAAEAAKALGIKVYTIGAGSRGPVPYPVKDMFGNTVYRPVRIDIDEETLWKIAEKTGARYFRATDTDSLRDIYKEIDRLEKSRIEERGYVRYRELFHLFLVPALVIVAAETVLARTYLRRIP
jgi:Ca-activated chloride channel family protein